MYHKPVSKIATIVSPSDFRFLLAVCSLRYWFGITENTSFMPDNLSASSSDSLAANALKLFV
jgi:hypothetical protein